MSTVWFILATVDLPDQTIGYSMHSSLFPLSTARSQRFGFGNLDAVLCLAVSRAAYEPALSEVSPDGCAVLEFGVVLEQVLTHPAVAEGV
ncbi:hypothetical protein GGI43DRAFT_379155 [Trichoderma evansii]